MLEKGESYDLGQFDESSCSVEKDFGVSKVRAYFVATTSSYVRCLKDAGIHNVLMSYPYFRKGIPECAKGMTIMLDSGAYTNFNKPGSVVIDDYMDFLKTEKSKVKEYVTFDDIRSPARTFRNHSKMLSAGLSPMFVDHLGTPLDRHALKHYTTGEKTCIGGMITHPAFSAKQKSLKIEGNTYALPKQWDIRRTKIEEDPGTPLHLLGVGSKITRFLSLLKYVDSVDFTSWMVPGSYGEFGTVVYRSNGWPAIRAIHHKSIPPEIKERLGSRDMSVRYNRDYISAKALVRYFKIIESKGRSLLRSKALELEKGLADDSEHDRLIVSYYTASKGTLEIPIPGLEMRAATDLMLAANPPTYQALDWEDVANMASPFEPGIHDGFTREFFKGSDRVELKAKTVTKRDHDSGFPVLCSVCKSDPAEFSCVFADKIDVPADVCLSCLEWNPTGATSDPILKELGLSPVHWFHNTNAEQAPKVLSKELVSSGVMPEPGQSALSVNMMAQVPMELRYWDVEDQSVAKSVRDTLATMIAKGDFGFSTGPVSKPFPNEHAARQLPPEEFEDFRRIAPSGLPKGVTFILGIRQDNTTAIQSVRFESPLWDEHKAKQWLDEHEFSAAAFEPASSGVRTTQDPVGKSIPILKIDADKRIVIGIVLEPDEVDAQSDTISAEAIEKAAHDYLADYGKTGGSRLGFMHSKFGDVGFDLVRSWIALTDQAIAGHPVKKGSWLMGVRINSDALWSDVKAGKLTGFSIGGIALTSRR